MTVTSRGSRIERVAACCIALLITPLPILIAGLISTAPIGLVACGTGIALGLLGFQLAPTRRSSLPLARFHRRRPGSRTSRDLVDPLPAFDGRSIHHEVARPRAGDFRMMAAVSSIPSRLVLGSIRHAEPRDAAELARLFEATGVATPLLADRDRGHLLVLDRAGSLAAAGYVVLHRGPDRRRAQLQLLVVDPALGVSARHIEDRMIGVVLAMCEAYGCGDLDIGPASRAGVA